MTSIVIAFIVTFVVVYTAIELTAVLAPFLL